MKILKHALAILFVLFSTQAIAGIVEGKDYTVVGNPQSTGTGNKIEILEFFFYGCGHCFHLHPELTSWERNIPRDVELVYVPTIFNRNWEPMAYTYYALEVLGKNHDLHHDLYEAWNVSNTDINNETRVTEFVTQHGVDRKEFIDAYRSFGVQSKIMRSKQLTQTYNIRGTPTLIVDGKYLITGLQPAAMIKVMNELIDKVRKERAGRR